MANKEFAAYREARKAIEKKRAFRTFLIHVTAYIIGNIFLGTWNILTYYVRENQTLWFYIPILFWGVGVIIHYLQAVALFDDWWELDERTINNRLEG